MEEFGIPQRENPNQTALQPSWRFGNGMFALVLSFGLLWTALRSRKARSWRYGTGDWTLHWNSYMDYLNEKKRILWVEFYNSIILDCAILIL